jgi:hypothetical protein
MISFIYGMLKSQTPTSEELPRSEFGGVKGHKTLGKVSLRTQNPRKSKFEIFIVQQGDYTIQPFIIFLKTAERVDFVFPCSKMYVR